MNNPPLHAALEAVQAGDPEALRPLLEADPSLVGAPLPNPFSTSPTSIDVGGDGRMRRPLPTLLHRAALGWRESELQVAQLVIDHGADVNSTEGGALAPLEMAAWSRHPGMAALLIAAGADVELHVEVPPVEVSVLYQRREIFKLLIAAGARYDISHTLRLGMMAETRALLAADPAIVNTETDHGLPLNLAVGKPGIFKLLLRHGADIHAEDSLGLTPLKAARTPESDKEVRALLEMGVEDDIYGALAACDEARVEAILKADPSQAHPVRCWPRRGPIPPVIWAVWSGSTRILGLILEQDVPLDIRPNPLNTAIGYGYVEMVRMLLDRGASPGCADCSDWPGASTYPPYRPLSLPVRPPAHGPLHRALGEGNMACRGDAARGGGGSGRHADLLGRPSLAGAGRPSAADEAVAGPGRRSVEPPCRGHSPLGGAAVPAADDRAARHPRRRHRHGRRERQRPAGHGGPVRWEAVP